jgi:hypothetical protein
MNLFIKYNKEFADMMKINESTSKCTRNKCNSLHENFIKKKAEIAEKIKKESDIILKKRETINFEKKVLELNNYFLSSEAYKNYITQKIKDKKTVDAFQKELKKKSIKYNKLVKEYNKNPDIKKHKNNIQLYTKELVKSNEALLLKKCSFKECNKLHKTGVEFIKKFADTLCNKEKAYCDVIKYINKLNINNLTYKQNSELIEIIKKSKLL